MGTRLGVRNWMMGTGSNNGIPFAYDAFEIWEYRESEIITVGQNKYFKGKNGHNLLITGYDFEAGWNKGFLYKSAATVSAPAGDTAFIAADRGNFWYDSGGNPNQIPVVALYQNVDYANWLFNLHYERSQDYYTQIETYAPRVWQTVLYNNPKAGEGLNSCNSYFRTTTKQSANIREVGVGKTYSTLEAALTASVAGDKIYIYTGVYTHPTTYYSITKNCTIEGIGRVELKQPGTTTVCYQFGQNVTYKRLILNAESKTTNILTTDTQVSDDLYQTNVYNCYFKNINTRINPGSRGYIWDIRDCVAEKSTSFLWGFYKGSVVGCKIKNATMSAVGSNIGKTLTMKYCKYEQNYMDATPFMTLGNGEFEIFNNKITLTSTGIYSTGTQTNRAVGNINYNYFTLRNNTSNNAVYGINLVDAYVSGSLCNIKHNLFVQSETLTLSTNFKCIALTNNSANVEYNAMLTATDRLVNHIDIAFSTSGNLSTYTIKNNYILGHRVNTGSGGWSVSIGGEAAFDNCHQNSIIENNYIGNIGTNTGLHSLLVNCGNNVHIRYNKLEGNFYGIVVKTGTTAKTYTSGGIYGNVINCSQGIRIKGVSGINVFNNVIAGVTSAGVYCDENNVIAGDQFTENCIIKNNIITGTLGSLLLFDQHAADNGCIAQNNQLYGGQYLMTAGALNYADLATAQAANRLLNCAVGNPNLTTGLWPTTTISIGEVLDSAYEDGLGITTNWGSTTTVPSVVTKKQTGTNWQVGAFVQ